MNPREEGIKLLIEIAKDLLYETKAGGDLGYHLNCPEWRGRLEKALALMNEINLNTKDLKL